MSDELAKEIAEALVDAYLPRIYDEGREQGLPDDGKLWLYLSARDERTKERRRMLAAILPILRPHIERHERLRKVAFDAGVSMLRASDHLCDPLSMGRPDEQERRNSAKHSLLENLAALRTALDEETKGSPNGE